MALERFLAAKAVVTYDEIADYLDEHGSPNVRSQESLVRYHVQKGRLLRVRRGLYVVVPPGAIPDTCPVDPYLLASKMADDAVLAYGTALSFHGRAYSVSKHFTYLTNTSPRPLTFRGYRFRPVRQPKPLRDAHRESSGMKACDRSGQNVRATTLERTLVDALDRPELTGSWEEIWRSLESVEFFNLDMVVEYALLLGNATTVAKVGYFLEQHRERLMVEGAYLETLKRHRPRQPHYMDRNDPARGRLEGEWSLIVPDYIAERAWEEVR
jgi:predicted transcriptional regulator of viral defense system